MRVMGIVAEYNPLHNGHIYHMEQAKRLTGDIFAVNIPIILVAYNDLGFIVEGTVLKGRQRIYTLMGNDSFALPVTCG